MLDFGHVGSIGVHLCDESSGRVGLGAEGSLRASYRLTDDDAAGSPSASPAPPKSTSPPGPPRSTPTSPASACCKPGDLAELRGDRPSSPPSCASRPSTRWAPRGSPPTQREGACAPDGSVHGTRDLYVADASLFPTSVGVNPMMTVIAFAKQVARGVAGEGFA